MKKKITFHPHKFESESVTDKNFSHVMYSNCSGHSRSRFFRKWSQKCYHLLKRICSQVKSLLVYIFNFIGLKTKKQWVPITKRYLPKSCNLLAMSVASTPHICLNSRVSKINSWAMNPEKGKHEDDDLTSVIGRRYSFKLSRFLRNFWGEIGPKKLQHFRQHYFSDSIFWLSFLICILECFAC